MRATFVGAAGAGWGGVAAPLGLLVLTEAGIPLPVPADLLMLFVGERAAAGSLPLWLAAIAPGRACRAVLVVGVLVRAVARRRSRHERIGAVLEWSEAACPACLVVSAVRAGRTAQVVPARRTGNVVPRG